MIGRSFVNSNYTPKHMGLNYSRLLRDDDSVEHFLGKVLQVDHKVAPAIIRKIVTSEKMLMDFKDEENTLVSTKYRDRGYVNDLDRWRLRKQIIHELFTMKRTGNEEETRLGNGGALPHSDVRKEKKAYILIGPPASGKSTIANEIAEKKGAIILDNDLAKRKLPEFDYECGATFVQEESNRMIFGFREYNPLKLYGLSELAVGDAYNVVIPKIGKEPGKIISLARFLVNTAYEVHLTLVYAERRDATIRALKRFDETKRYVPLGYIFDDVANDPLLSYYMLKEGADPCFHSFGVITTGENRYESRNELNLQGANPACWYKAG